MNTTAKVSSFGKQSHSFPDPPDADPKADLFAALFSVPVAAPLVSIRLPKPSPEASKGAGPSVDDTLATINGGDGSQILSVPVDPSGKGDSLKLGIDLDPNKSLLSVKDSAPLVEITGAAAVPPALALPVSPFGLPIPMHPHAESKNGPSSNISLEISNCIPKTVAENAITNYFAASAFQRLGTKDVPKTIKDLTSLVAVENFQKIDFSADPLAEQNGAQQFSQTLAGDGDQALLQRKSGLIRTLKDTENSEQNTEMSVASSIRLATKVPNTVEAATTANKLGETVFEQIDPRILELTAATHRDNERRTLKMRLNPAELGTIEITVEKSSTGKVNVHFKTERQETRQILNDSLVNLRDSLERSGTNVGDVDITCSSFASNGNESRGERPQTFGTTENQPVGTANFDGISQHEDDKDDRLVNLRA